VFIHDNGTIYLAKGDEFVSERQDDDNIFRIATINLASGMQVEVKRHFSQIRPGVFNSEGWELDIELDRESGLLLSRGVHDTGYGGHIRRSMNMVELISASQDLTYRAEVAYEASEEYLAAKKIAGQA
jgi:hypothetical protein